MKFTRKRVLDNKGTAAVEFALVLPLLIVLVFGIIEFSLLLYNKQMITNASREGARAGIVWLPGGVVSDDDIKGVVTTYCENNLVTFGSMKTPDISIEGTRSSPGGTCIVKVTYNYDFLVLPNFIPGLSRVTTLNAVTVMRQE